jgi:hypothetical protein
MDEAVERVVEREGVGLLANEASAFFKAQMADILSKK